MGGAIKRTQEAGRKPALGLVCFPGPGGRAGERAESEPSPVPSALFTEQRW